MDKSKPAKQSANPASSEDVRRIFRHLDDHAVASVLALKPTVAELEEASTRIGGEGDIFADVRPAKGAVEAIIEIVDTLEEEPDDR